jgi:hypothetical protein
VIVECRGLLAEIITFVSQYDNAVFDGMSIEDDILGLENQKIYWLKDHPFRLPLQSEKVHFCLRYLVEAIDLLETHVVRRGDDVMNDARFNVGHDRRLGILQKLTTPPNFGSRALFAEIAFQVLNLVAADEATLRELSDLAGDIHADLIRMRDKCKSVPDGLEFNYQGRTASK